MIAINFIRLFLSMWIMSTNNFKECLKKKGLPRPSFTLNEKQKIQDNKRELSFQFSKRVSQFLLWRETDSHFFLRLLRYESLCFSLCLWQFSRDKERTKKKKIQERNKNQTPTRAIIWKERWEKKKIKKNRNEIK